MFVFDGLMWCEVLGYIMMGMFVCFEIFFVMFVVVGLVIRLMYV